MNSCLHCTAQLFCCPYLLYCIHQILLILKHFLLHVVFCRETTHKGHLESQATKGLALITLTSLYIGSLLILVFFTLKLFLIIFFQSDYMQICWICIILHLINQATLLFGLIRHCTFFKDLHALCVSYISWIDV